MVSQGSESLALGLAKTAATQLDEFVRSRTLAFWAKPVHEGVSPFDGVLKCFGHHKVGLNSVRRA